MSLKNISIEANSFTVIEQLLKQINVKVTTSSIKRNLEAHPDFPSFLSINDCLVEWGVRSESYQIDTKNFDKRKLSYPFVAHFEEQGGRFVLIKSIEDKKVFYSDEKTENGVLIENDFLKRWTGFILYASPEKQNGEVDYSQNRFKERLSSLLIPTAILVMVVIFYMIFVNQPINWSIWALTFLKLCGVGISILLLVQSLDANNIFVKNLCNIGGGNDCNAILKSNAANATPWLSWSEVGFFYFTGSLLSLLFVPLSATILAWLSFFALPYTVYSITYQYKNKKWCTLCCTVQALLVLEVITLLMSSINVSLWTSHFPLNVIVLLVICFLIPILTWSFLKPIFIDSTQIKSLKLQLKKFKYNSDLFNLALKNQQCYAVPDNLLPIRLGNPEARTTITIVSNPFCGPCSNAHQVIEQWLKVNSDINFKIIFSTKNKEEDRSSKLAKHFISLDIQDKSNSEKAISEWYNMTTNDYESWAKKYPINRAVEADEIIKRHFEWSEMVEIKFTPTIFINGYKLPDAYRIEDIKYLLA